MAFVDPFVNSPDWATELDIKRAAVITRHFVVIGMVCFVAVLVTILSWGPREPFWLIWSVVYLIGSTVLLYLTLTQPQLIYATGRLGVALILLMALYTHFGSGYPFPMIANVGIFGVIIAGSLFSSRQIALITGLHCVLGIAALMYWWPAQHLDMERRYLIINAITHIGTTLGAWVVGVVLLGSFRLSWVEARGVQHELNKRNDEAQRLLNVAYSLRTNMPLPAQCNLILQKLNEAIAYDKALIARRVQNTQRFEPVSGDLCLMDQVKQLNIAQHSEQPLSPKSLKLTLTPIEQPLTQLNCDGPVPHDRQLFYVPLPQQDEYIGVLIACRQGTLTAEESNLIEQFAQYVTVALINANAHEQSVQAAALAERSRLARDLHDSVSQALFGIVLGAKTLSQAAEQHDPTREASRYILNLSEIALTEMRALIFELHPESLRTEGLTVALQKQLGTLCHQHKIQLNLQFDPTEPQIQLRAKEALYRISLEAVQNTIKHARASRIDLSLRTQLGLVQLEIQDDGCGFDPQRQYSGHLGLVSMRERAAEVGAQLEVNSAASQGVRIRVVIPVWHSGM